MTIKKEMSLTGFGGFEFWSGAADRVQHLTDEELDTIERVLVAEYPDGITETELNDLFWFDFDFICELIGETEESVLNREDEED